MDLNKSELDKVKKVRDIVKNKGFKVKIINQTNNGLSKSIIKGITRI